MSVSVEAWVNRRPMREERVHVFAKAASDGWARTACGILAPEGMTTRTAREVTCQRAGCKQDSPFETAEEKIALARALESCAICSKMSDGARTLEGLVLCGTHFDEWLRSPEHAHANPRSRRRPVGSLLIEFIARRQAELRNGNEKRS